MPPIIDPHDEPVRPGALTPPPLPDLVDQAPAPAALALPDEAAPRALADAPPPVTPAVEALVSVPPGEPLPPDLGAPVALDPLDLAAALATLRPYTPPAVDPAEPSPSGELSWRILGGDEAWRFAIAPGTGALSLRVAPGPELPADTTWTLDVETRDGWGRTSRQLLEVAWSDLVADTLALPGRAAEMPAPFTGDEGPRDWAWW